MLEDVVLLVGAEVGAVVGSVVGAVAGVAGGVVVDEVPGATTGALASGFPVGAEVGALVGGKVGGAVCAVAPCAINKHREMQRNMWASILTCICAHANCHVSGGNAANARMYQGRNHMPSVIAISKAWRVAISNALDFV